MKTAFYKRITALTALVLAAAFTCYGQSAGGGDVLIVGTDSVGHEGGKPCYWLNGKRQALPIPGAYGNANAIAVAGSNVYIAGDNSNGGASLSLLLDQW
jgi:hypothetical protein